MAAVANGTPAVSLICSHPRRINESAFRRLLDPVLPARHTRATAPLPVNYTRVVRNHTAQHSRAGSDKGMTVALDSHCATMALALLQRINGVKTGSFRTYTGSGRISIARWTPRHTPAGYRVYKRLAPGPWFNSVGIEEYCHLYGEILKKLDPKRVYAELVALVAPEEPVLLCWEVPPFTAPRPIPQVGLTVVGRSNWCHRRLVARVVQTDAGHRRARARAAGQATRLAIIGTRSKKSAESHHSVTGR
jgi:hypothetical protein